MSRLFDGGNPVSAARIPAILIHDILIHDMT